MAENQSIQAVKGMNDIRPGAAKPFLDSRIWERILGVAASVLDAHGFRRVWLPSLEETRLFARGIGEDTDIVAKEMYTFEDRGGRSLTLRPEGTAGAVRAYIEHNLPKTDPIQRWWYFGPMFRAESPQKGRYRQFYQFGAELLGVVSPVADAELLALLFTLCGRLQLSGVRVAINTVGDSESRRAYRERLQVYLREHTGALCDDCRRRIDSNPLRCLDCKRETCRPVVAKAPDIMEVLTQQAREHFDRVCTLLDALGVPFERDAHLVRGLDYYTGTIFELTTSALGAQDAILGGGRYDDLVESLGGPPTPAIGFAAGVERFALLVAQQKITHAGPDLYIIPMKGAEARALRLADELRGAWVVEVDVSEGRLKKQMRRADRLGARAALVIGEDELASGRGKMKNLQVSSQQEVALTPEALSRALSEIAGAQEPQG